MLLKINLIVLAAEEAASEATRISDEAYDKYEHYDKVFSSSDNTKASIDTAMELAYRARVAARRITDLLDMDALTGAQEALRLAELAIRNARNAMSTMER